LGEGYLTSSLGVFELGASIRPHPRVAITGGYRRERYTHVLWLTELFGVKSPTIDFDLSGPMIGVQVEF
jgi:hypothetical protein